jgi:hypothetical protein
VGGVVEDLEPRARDAPRDLLLVGGRRGEIAEAPTTSVGAAIRSSSARRSMRPIASHAFA